jgi:hypothetical protein
MAPFTAARSNIAEQFAPWLNQPPQIVGPYCNCGICIDDPNWTCSYTGEDQSVNSVYIANAYKGDLLLTPGGAMGVIGGLLHQLNPPQHYTHMGIMVADNTLIRHCPAEQNQLTAKEYFTGSINLGPFSQPAPTDGLNKQHLRYGWPGAITQSVEQAYYADRYNGMLPGNIPYSGDMLPDPDSRAGTSYRINALGFNTVFDGSVEYPPLIVTPCPNLLAQNQQTSQIVTNALNRVAEAALQIYAHYRFNCYSRAVIAEDPNFMGFGQTVLDALPDYIADPTDPNFGKWRDWTGFSWSNPHLVKVRTVPYTIPAVCSSFVWQSVRNANKAGGPKITLDSAEKPEPLDAPGCQRRLSPDYAGDTAAQYTDGLYLYDEASRKKVAEWWSSDDPASLWSTVYAQSSGALPTVIGDLIGLIGRPAFIAAAEIGAAALEAALAAAIIAAGPVGAAVVAALANAGVVLDVQLADALIQILYDIPNDITTQVLNELTFDCVNGFPGDQSCVDAQGNPINDPLDDDNFKDHPGLGLAVSPDNIHMFWDPPVVVNADEIHGIYGWNWPAQVIKGVTMHPICRKIPSNGTATIRGLVKYKGKVVAGARITAACQSAFQPAQPPDGVRPFTMKVKSGGLYKLVARYVDADGSISGRSGRGLYGEVTVPTNWNQGPNGHVIEPNTTYDAEIELLDPPQCMRRIIIEGDIHVYDGHVGGHDENTMHFKDLLMVQAGVPKYAEDPNNPGNFYWVCDTSDPNAHYGLEDPAHESNSPSDEDTSALLDMDVKISNASLPENDPDYLAVDVTLMGTLNPNDENMKNSGVIHVRKDMTVSVTNSYMDTGGSFSDGVQFNNIKITNQSAEAF